MPFLGQDWRSPGCVWVRTCSGWERLLRQDPSREFGETESFHRIEEQNQRNNEKHQGGETVDNMPACGAHCGQYQTPVCAYRLTQTNHVIMRLASFQKIGYQKKANI